MLKIGIKIDESKNLVERFNMFRVGGLKFMGGCVF